MSTTTNEQDKLRGPGVQAPGGGTSTLGFKAPAARTLPSAIPAQTASGMALNAPAAPVRQRAAPATPGRGPTPERKPRQIAVGIGQAARGGIAAADGAIEFGENLLNEFASTGAGIGRDIRNGFTGTVSPDAGRPAEFRPAAFPRIARTLGLAGAGGALAQAPELPNAPAEAVAPARPRPPASAPAVPAAPAAGRPAQTPVLVSDVDAPPDSMFGTAARQRPRTLDGREGSVASGIGAYGENVYDNASIGRMGGPTIPTASVQSPFLGAPTLPTGSMAGGGGGGGGAQGTVIGDPDAERAAAQVRRSDMEWDMRINGRGSPTMRRAIADQYKAEGDAQIDREQMGVTLANNAANNATTRAEGAASRQLRGLELASNIAERSEQGRRVTRTLTGADGNAYSLNNDGQLAPLTGPDGQPFKPAAERSEGAITPKARLDYLGDQRKAIMDSMTMDKDQRASALAEIDAQIGTLLGTTQGSAQQPPQAAIAQLRANPGTAAAFDEIFGKGSAARLLGN